MLTFFVDHVQHFVRLHCLINFHGLHLKILKKVQFHFLQSLSVNFGVVYF